MRNNSIVSDFYINDLRYVEARADDGTYTLTTYSDGVINSRVTKHPDSDELLYEEFPNVTRSTDDEVSVKSKTYKISDIITVMNEPVKETRAYTVKEGSIGSVKYQAVTSSGTVTRTLPFTSTYVSNKTGNFLVNVEEYVAWSIILTAVVEGFKNAVPTSLASAILGKLLDMSKDYALESVKVTVNGTAYKYKVNATKNGNAHTETGYTYYGTLKKGSTTYTNRTAHSGSYPEFISKKDRSVEFDITRISGQIPVTKLYGDILCFNDCHIVISNGSCCQL